MSITKNPNAWHACTGTLEDTKHMRTGFFRSDETAGPRARAMTKQLMFLLGIAVLTVTGWNVADAADNWPQRPILVVLPYAPGGTIDYQARIMSAGISQKLGQPVIVESKPGAAGIIATDYVIRSKPDGYTLLFGSSAQTTSVPMTKKVNYKLSDLIPISASGNGPMILACNSSMPVHSLKEFIAYVKAHPGKFNYGSAGNGSVAHLVGALFVARAGLEATHVPFRGGGPAAAALLADQVDFYFGNSADIMTHAADKRMRILAVSTPKRMAQLPDVPAVDEVIPGFTMTAWQGFLAPAHTPQPIVDKLAKTIAEVARDPEIVKKIALAGVEATSTTQAQFNDIIKNEQATYAAAVKAAGLKQE